MTENNRGAQHSKGTQIVLQGGLCGRFVEFDYLPYLLADMEGPGLGGLIWAEVLDSIRAATQKEMRRVHGMPELPSIPLASAHEAAEGAWQLCGRLGLIEAGSLTDAGRKVASIAKQDQYTSFRDTLVPILAKGVESALTGQAGSPLVPMLRTAAHRISSVTSIWAQQCPGLLPVEVAAIVHWACIDMQRAHALVRDIEFNRDRAMDGVPLPDADDLLGEDAELAFHRTMEFYLDRRDLLGQVSAGENEIRALSRLLAYCGLFKAIRFLEPTMENFYLIPS